MDFPKFAFLLTEEQSSDPEPSIGIKDSMPAFGSSPLDTEDLVTKMGHLLIAKIQAHSGLKPELFTPSEVLRENGKSLAPIMYRIATENFIKSSTSEFKIIECRNSTKLVSDWKPRVPEILNALGHQVVVVELKESFSAYNDFAYAVLRLINYDWKIRLPRSFFYPDDVCTVHASADGQLLHVSPLMPDGEIEFPDHIKQTLQYDILMMLKASCETAMENHLLMRDMRVGKFDKTSDGIASIRSVYRSLQERVRDGKDLSFGLSSVNDMLYAGGDTMMAENARGVLQEYENEKKKCGNTENSQKSPGLGGKPTD